jgi:FtsP/CotA-like multicopper oxidase with cupredoxin domain
VVEDPDEPERYDREAVVVLDDWTDGLGPTPAAILTSLRRSGGMGEMKDQRHDAAHDERRAGWLACRCGRGDRLRPLPGQRPSPEDPATLAARLGERLRLVNAAANTAFRIALGGHRR